VLVKVEAFGSIGEQPYTVTTIVCGDCCNFQLSANRRKWNMGFLKKIKFCKKRNNNTPTLEDACVSTKDPRTCDAATVSMDGGGGGAAKEEFEREFEMKNRSGN